MSGLQHLPISPEDVVAERRKDRLNDLVKNFNDFVEYDDSDIDGVIVLDTKSRFARTFVLPKPSTLKKFKKVMRLKGWRVLDPDVFTAEEWEDIKELNEEAWKARNTADIARFVFIVAKKRKGNKKRKLE